MSKPTPTPLPAALGKALCSWVVHLSPAAHPSTLFMMQSPVGMGETHAVVGLLRIWTSSARSHVLIKGSWQVRWFRGRTLVFLLLDQEYQPWVFLPLGRVCHSLDFISFWFIDTLSFLVGLTKAMIWYCIWLLLSVTVGVTPLCDFLHLNQKPRCYIFKFFPLAFMLLPVYLHFHLCRYFSLSVIQCVTLYAALYIVCPFLIFLSSLCAPAIGTVLVLYHLFRAFVSFLFLFLFGLHGRRKGSHQYLLTSHKKIMLFTWERLALWQWNTKMNLLMKLNMVPTKLFGHSRAAAWLWGSHILNSLRSAELWFQYSHPSLSTNV